MGLLVLGLSALSPSARVAQPALQSILVVVDVKDCDSGEPIAGARVTVVNASEDDEVLAQGTTGPDGKFSAVILILAFNVPDAAAKIDVLVEKEGYTPGLRVKFVLQGPQGPFISASVCLRASASGSGSQPGTETEGERPDVECEVTATPAQPLASVIAQAAKGSVVCLQPGAYAVGGLTIGKGLTLVGLGTDPAQTVLRGNRQGPVLSLVGVEAPVVVWNLTVRDGSGAGPEERGGGVHIENSADVTLRRVIVTENVRVGVFARLSGVRIEGSRVLHTFPATPGQDGHGVRARGSAVRVVRSVLRGNGGYGLAARDAGGEPSRVLIEEATIEGNTFAGLNLYDASRLEVRRSRIAANRPHEGWFGYGISVGAEGELLVEDTVIEGHRGLGEVQIGVILTEDAVATLRRNTIQYNDWGVWVGHPDIPLEGVRAEFVENVVQNSDNCGLWIDEDEFIEIAGSGNQLRNNGRSPAWNLCGTEAAKAKVPPGF